MEVSWTGYSPASETGLTIVYEDKFDNANLTVSVLLQFSAGPMLGWYEG